VINSLYMKKFFTDLFGQVAKDAQEKIEQNDRNLTVQTGVTFIFHYLDSVDRGGDSRIILTSVRAHADFIRAALAQWDALAQKEPAKFTPKQKQRISELLHEATKKE